jgi:hypothetical protein
MAAEAIAVRAAPLLYAASLVSPLTVLCGALLLALLLTVLALGLFSRRSGADVLGLEPARPLAGDPDAEAEDVAQLLEAQNAARARRGAPERRLADVEREVGWPAS